VAAVPAVTAYPATVAVAAVPVVFWFSTGTSDAVIVPHAGALAVPPDPVPVRNIFAAEVFPASRTGTEAPLSNSMSPGVVSTDVSPKLQVAAVPDEAVRTWPAAGAVAPSTATVVVAEFRAFAAAAVVALPAVVADPGCQVALPDASEVSTSPAAAPAVTLKPGFPLKT